MDEVREAYAQSGVDRIALNACGELFNQPENAAVLDEAKRHPDFVIPFAFIVPGQTTGDEVRRLHGQGFRGLKTQNPAVAYDDRLAYPVYEVAQELKLPILFHTGMGARFPLDAKYDVDNERHRPVRLDKVARAFPELHMIGAHFGLPWVWEAAFAAAYNPNLYFDLAGVDRTGKVWPTLLNFKELLWLGDAHHAKLMFGTEGAPENIDWVKREYEELLETLNVQPATRRLVMGGNLQRMLGLDENK